VTAKLISKALLRLAALFWLGAVIAAPAVAEVGCIREAAAHLQPGSGFSYDTVSNTDEDDGPGESRAVSHCAFGHSACGGILQSAPETRDVVPVAPEFVSAPVKELATVARDGQERPPKA
jgi:hypothetical protein